MRSDFSLNRPAKVGINCPENFPNNFIKMLAFFTFFLQFHVVYVSQLANTTDLKRLLLQPFSTINLPKFTHTLARHYYLHKIK